jgi:hypothetical protein
MADVTDKVVARYVDSRVVKGYAPDFDPDKRCFHLFRGPADDSVGREVHLRDLKAVFFVRDFGGDPQYNERKCFREGEWPPGRKVEVTFVDGEVLVGSTTTGYAPEGPGFLFSPADPRSNNVKVFAVANAVRRVRYL